jgi:hypothetical protein
VDKYRNRVSILKMAREEGISPDAISAWLHRIGVDVKQGQHFVEQPRLQISDGLQKLLLSGPNGVIDLVQSRAWGVQLSDYGIKQLERFCKFVNFHQSGFGVKEISRDLDVHRSTVTEWRTGSNRPYLVKLAEICLRDGLRSGCKWLPLRVQAGGNKQSNWIQVPSRVNHYEDIEPVVKQLAPLERSVQSIANFGVVLGKIESLRVELFGYMLGILLGDAGKRGGELNRVSSMNIDLQLIKSKPTNLRLGQFVCVCCGLLGLKMHRVKDKPPSGDQLLGANPGYAYRWLSERSPLIGWMFHDCLGMNWNKVTSTSQVNMERLFTSPREFRKRFVQGMADSDGTVRLYTAEIASMPNAEFVTKILVGLGMTSAHTRFEGGKPTRSVVRIGEAAELPIFNEFSDGYRFRKLRSLNLEDTDIR